MEYFLIAQDQEYNNAPIINDIFNKMNGRHKENSDYNKLDSNEVLTLKKQSVIEYIDWIDRQILLISEKTKNVIKLYLPYTQFKNVMLHNKEQKNNQLYYIPEIKLVNCLSENSTWNFDESGLTNIILEESNIPNLPIFQIADVRSRYIIGRLDIVESFLRRDVEGIKFSKIEVQ